MEEAWLGVDGTNPTGALQLYERLGFTVGRRWQAFGRPMDGPAPEGWTSGADSRARSAGDARARRARIRGADARSVVDPTRIAGAAPSVVELRRPSASTGRSDGSRPG